ncbi:ABC transporter substrate-binding protein [Roseomonas haemaphysalidis]|uniref:ABC transporter substrate-binding protein n=1 Tax=Roseomonas haemaphysalidis TaxID=2768162 RepID=A0ABS3KVM1_9PROT|nr:ABC transporter substrate-binding protein [Roseomonas haemaphysalidis]MBO1081484.1 ABC transporter substrate-binding protein [Roseomonas haemaphysalidis]
MTNTPFTAPRRRALLAAAAATLAFPAIARAQSLPVLRVGNQRGGVRSLLEASGQDKGMPFRIEWSEFPAAAPLLEALNAGALDLGSQGEFPFLAVYANGAPIRAVGATRADPRSQAILVRGDSPLKTVADLRGRRIAINRGGWGHFLARAALAEAKVDASEVTLVPLGPVDAALAFRSGAIDAWPVWQPYVAIETETFGARVLRDGAGLCPSVTLTSAHADALQSKRPLIQDFLRRQQEGWDWARGHLPAFAATTAALTRIPEPLMRIAQASQDTRSVALDQALIAELQQAADRAVEYGVLSRKVSVAAALDTEFVSG